MRPARIGTWFLAAACAAMGQIQSPPDVRSLTGPSEYQGQAPWVGPSPFMGTMVFDIPAPAGDRPTGETISAARLRHKVPKEAQKLYKLGYGELVRGELNKAEEHLLRAIAIDPAYMDAHCDLGVLYVRWERYHEAEAEFRKTLALEPEFVVALSNLAWTLLSLERPEEARASANRALRIAPGDGPAHLLLAKLMLENVITRAEGMKHLEVAARSMRTAQEALEQLRGR